MVIKPAKATKKRGERIMAEIYARAAILRNDGVAWILHA
jgi:hypothetical protein